MYLREQESVVNTVLGRLLTNCCTILFPNYMRVTFI